MDKVRAREAAHRAANDAQLATDPASALATPPTYILVAAADLDARDVPDPVLGRAAVSHTAGLVPP